ncbi:aminotransferase class V-fold PLP-dependent enzyme [Flavobacteriaceae bacterium M23B6Z8]
MDIETIRRDTPGCENRIFLNSAGASLMPVSVVEKMKEYLSKEQLLGGYTMASESEAQINEFYKEAGNLINCKPQNIAFTYNATDSFSRALSAIPVKTGDSILTTHDDYSSNEIAFLSFQKRFGIKLLKAKNLQNGAVDLDNFEELALKHKPKLVVLTHIPTNSGIIQPAKVIGAICKRINTWYLLDACQSVGQIPVDVAAIGCDFLSVTGRKFLRGPRGTGFLYVSDRALNEGLEPLFIDTRGADLTGKYDYEAQKTAIRFETWEFSYMSLIGLTEALRYLNNLGIDQIYNYNQELMQTFRKNMESLDGIHLLDVGPKLSNILTFYRENTSLDKMKYLLDANRVDYTVSYENYAARELINANVEWVVRLSPHYFNTPDELNNLVEAIHGK